MRKCCCARPCGRHPLLFIGFWIWSGLRNFNIIEIRTFKIFIFIPYHYAPMAGSKLKFRNFFFFFPRISEEIVHVCGCGCNDVSALVIFWWFFLKILWGKSFFGFFLKFFFLFLSQILFFRSLWTLMFQDRWLLAC